MKRNPILNIIGSAIVFIYGLLLSSCTNNQSTWQETINGNKLFIDNSNYVYEWEGDTFDRLIHGEGVLKVHIKDSLIKTSSVTAYYGAISKDDIIYINDTTQYIGNVKRHKQNGFGVIIQPHNIYVGELHKSKPHGHLSWFQNGKLRYKGDWTEGRRDGYGTSYDKDGVYSGSFSNNFYNGEGEKEYDAGFSYYGEWLNGQRNGYGNLHVGDLVYCGSFSNGLPCGTGSLSIGDSCFTYYGNWDNGQICRYGECVYANDDSYRGNWLNNQFEGFGIYEYASGDVYEGEWKQGLQEGKGQYISNDFTYVGEFEGGWINGEGQMNYANGDWYEGDFYQNERFGVGCYHFKNGNYYEGEFVNDTINGLGIFHFQDGCRYEGEFEDGKIFGDGTLYINVNDENVAITAFWDGTNNLPTEASVLFGNGDLYEGELINGTPTDNGIWTTQKERDSGKSLLGKANDFYKEHRDTWNKAVIITSSALAAVEIFAPPVGGVIGKKEIGEAIAKCADIANEALNKVDAYLAIGSAAYDVHEARENGEDPSDAYKTLATEIGMNVGSILLPKALKKIPIGKVIGKLSKPAAVKAAARIAQKAGKQISKVGTKIAKTSAAKAASRITKTIGRKSKNGFQKIVQIGKDKYGNLEKRFLYSKVGIRTNKIYQSIKGHTNRICKKIDNGKRKTSKESSYLKSLLPKTKIMQRLNEILAKGPIKLTDKELKELLEHPEYLREYYFTKTESKKGMVEFFIRLAMGDKKQVKQLLENPKIREKVNRAIRQGGGKHEWLMTKNFEDFLLNPKWGDDGPFLALALTELVQNTESVLFKHGGRHCGVNSGTFHNGLAKVIEKCSTKEELFVEIRKYAKEWLTPESYKEFEEIFKNVFEKTVV